MADSKCPDIELIHRYASGDEMSDSEKKLAESHIKECDDCRKEYDSIVATIKLLTGYWDGKTEDCFDSETLAEYLAGLADEVTSKRIEEHVRVKCTPLSRQKNGVFEVEQTSQNRCYL